MSPPHTHTTCSWFNMTSDLHSSSCWYKSLSQCVSGSISFMIALLASLEFSLVLFLCSDVCAHLLSPSHSSVPTFLLKRPPPPSLSPPFSFVLKLCFFFNVFPRCLFSSGSHVFSRVFTAGPTLCVSPASWICCPVWIGTLVLTNYICVWTFPDCFFPAL